MRLSQKDSLYFCLYLVYSKKSLVFLPFYTLFKTLPSSKHIAKL